MERSPPRPDPGERARRTFEIRTRGRAWRLGGKTGVIGIVNVTPDSFYAASRSAGFDAAVDLGVAHARSGAWLLDVGGESTRPGATPVGAAEEQARVVPVVAALAARVELPISVDTYKAEVARAALAAGATVVNDVSGGLLDPAMPEAVAEAGVPVIVGHLRGDPQTMRDLAVYRDVVAEVRDELGERVAAFARAGVPDERILVDPGIGFAKNAAQNLELLARLDEIAALGHPVVVGVSRKRFLGEVARRRGLADEGPEDRLAASLAVTVLAAERGAVLIRAHDVAATARALAAADAVLHGN